MITYRVKFFDEKGKLICWLTTPRKNEADAIAASTMENVTSEVERVIVQ